MFKKYQQRLLVALIAILVYLPGLGATPFWEWDEPVYASVARGMLETGDYILPKLNGEFYPDKPVLMYWFEALSFKIFGVSEFSARLPSAVASILISLLVYEIALILFNSEVALLSGIVCATSILLVTFGRSGFLDANFTLMLTFALYCFVKSRCVANRFFWSFLSGAALGLAILSRGPLGLALAIFASLLYSFIRADFSWLKERFLLAIIFGFLIFALPWYCAVEMYSGGAFLDNFFISQNLMRFISAPGIGAAPFYFYLQDLFIGLAPWSLFLISVLIYNIKNIANRLEDREQGLLFICVLAPIILLSLSATKWPHYMLPVVPPVAILIANRIRKSFLETGFITKCELFGFVIFGLILSGPWFSIGWLYRDPILQYPLWNGGVVASLFLLITILGGVLASFYKHRKNYKTAINVYICSGIVVAIVHANTLGLPIQREKPLNKIVGLFGQSLNDLETNLAVYGYRHLGLPYYMNRNYKQIISENELIDFFGNNQKAKVILPRKNWEEIKGRFQILKVIETSSYNDQFEGLELIAISNSNI